MMSEEFDDTKLSVEPESVSIKQYVDKERYDALLDRLSALEMQLSFNDRAAKLMKNRKPFIVVAIDEPYFVDVYNMIRDHEMLKGTWLHLDEFHYSDLIELWRKLIKDKYDGKAKI